MKKLLLVGSNHVHLKNYYELIKSYFDEVCFITDAAPSIIPVQSVVVNFSLKNPFTANKTIKAIKNKITEFKPDVIHVHQANSVALYTLWAAKNKNIPVVVTAWGSDVLLMPHKNVLLRQMLKYILRNATAFSSDSSFMAKEMDAIAGRKLNTVVANFGIVPPAATTVKENIIYSNRLHQPLYRINKIIESFTLFNKTEKGKGWRLVVGATGAQTEELKSLAASLGLNSAIEFVGWLNKEQNDAWYAKAKVFVSIPESDATSVSLLEAMAAGCLPVVSDLPANREWVTPGENGYIVKDVNASFFEGIVNFDFNTAAAINKKIIEGRATKDAGRAKFFSLYKSLLKKA